MHELDAIKRLEEEIRDTIRRSYGASEQPVYQHANGRRLYLSEAIKEGLEDDPVIGALILFIAPGEFVSVDRVLRSNQIFKKQRRIIFYLDTKPGQIGSSLLLELLKLKNGDEFSKTRFVRSVDFEYFQSQHINISSGEINEALSRIFRKTMNNFFSVKGKHFIRSSFILHLEELKVRNSNSIASYENYKNEIDNQSYSIIKQLNNSPTW